MNKTLFNFLFLFFLVLEICTAQIGGRHAFVSSSLPTNARVTALGGALISIKDNDVALAQMNPALADSIMHNQISLNHNFHFAGISHGNLALGRYIPRWGMLTHFALQYVNYGSFDATDQFGNVNGDFSANEIAFVVGTAKQLNERIRVGANLKFLTAAYESENALGMGLDLGVYYARPGSQSSWGLVLKNVGGELEPLVNSRRGLPFDLQIGTSRKLKHLPFRFSVIGHHLQNWYIRYDDPETDIQTSIFGDITEKSAFSRNFDNFFRHIIINGEFLIGKREQFRLRFGYDHLRRQELKVASYRSLGGFAFGFGINIKKFKLDYGIGNYHLAGAVNHLSLRYNLGKMFTKI